MVCRPDGAPHHLILIFYILPQALPGANRLVCLQHTLDFHNFLPNNYQNEYFTPQTVENK